MHLNGRCVLDMVLFHAIAKTGICYCKPGSIAYVEEQHSDCTSKYNWSARLPIYLLETQRKNHGISQLCLPTATDYNLKAEALQGFHFTLTSMRGEGETNQRQYRIQRSGNIALHQQQSNFMGFTATEGQESDAATGFSRESTNYISINNVEIVQATRAVSPHALGHTLHWWQETIHPFPWYPALQSCT